MPLNYYGHPLTMILPLKYLGRVLSVSDNDWPEVVEIIWKARKKWTCIYRILGRKGADART